MNSKAKGEISEAVIIAHLVKLGYPVCLPFGNNQRYDLIYEEDGKLVKAQCKTGRHINGCLVFCSCSTNGFTGKKTGYLGSVDVFLAYDPVHGDVYKVPVTHNKKEIRLRISPPKEKGIKPSTIWAKDFKI